MPNTPLRNQYQELIRLAGVVGAQSLSDQAALGRLHQFVEDLSSWHVAMGSEVELARSAGRELEASGLLVTLGLYRQAFASLRLALELLVACCHFASHKLELEDWRRDRADIRWSSVLGGENGVFSARQVNALFPELADLASGFDKRSRQLYRQLSEYVHGNARVWQASGSLAYRPEAALLWADHVDELAELAELALLVRYAREHADELRPAFGTRIGERTSHVPAIRALTSDGVLDNG